VSIPPAISTGRSAASSRAITASISVLEGLARTTGCGAIAVAPVSSPSMSSGNTISAGPGVPACAACQARATTSGNRPASLTSQTPLAMAPNMLV
jgi:hypothetical protein